MLLSNTQTYYQLQCWFYRLHPLENLPKVNPEKTQLIGQSGSQSINPINKAVFQSLKGHLDMYYYFKKIKKTAFYFFLLETEST